MVNTGILIPLLILQVEKSVQQLDHQENLFLKVAAAEVTMAILITVLVMRIRK